ncbi:uncharacterized protein LOC110497173 [Oncorhynchus mykiss]|uniref:PARP catalytic domain-containing protein n=2 Tax=Oncorhynchus mykiss TaxID=8022 RepID=A0A060YIA9_ONCMY|nr:uncharacterized protein LOC110497173 [Oncorhynchus mykiss]CDQ88880.1 unnamed protein product [Oncorhynchus mykiss]
MDVNPDSPYYINLLDSKSHPEDHREYVMFHGCSKEGAELIKRDGFKPSSADRMLGAGVYVSRDIRKACKYPLDVPDSEKRVLKVRVNVGRVKVIDRQNHTMQKTWHTVHGFDTAWVPPNVGMVLCNQEEDCVYDPKRIKVIEVMKVTEDNLSQYDHLQSGVSPEDSHVYVMYHGTSKQIAVDIQRNGFKPSKDGMLGAGVYLSRDIRKVIRYPLNTPLMTIPDSDRMVLKVKVDVGRVKVIKRQRHPMQKTWHTEHGFDTAWVPPNVGMVPSNQEEDCVYDPKRIKVLAMLKVPNLKNVNPWLNNPLQN